MDYNTNPRTCFTSTTAVTRAILAVSAPKAPRIPKLATDAAKLAISAASAPREVVPSVAREEALRSATSVARLVTLPATALMHTATTPMVVAMVATPAVVKADKARLATPAEATDTCLASVSTAASATTAARMATSLATALRSLPAVRRSATSASNLVTFNLSAPMLATRGHHRL
ncbi:hypothetical protein F5Y16DRAFT_200939 [Xylariaceae sp. FL0255]|nr:hypothetical protein F5Y16DRAFT_200939 [Xylariaceae sp. FL0255]